MVVLIAILLALAVLYFWLAGNWFARVLVSLPFGVAGVAMVLAGLFGPNAIANGGALVVGGVACGTLGWCVGSAPIWYYRYRDRPAEDLTTRDATFVIPYPGA